MWKILILRPSGYLIEVKTGFFLRRCKTPLPTKPTCTLCNRQKIEGNAEGEETYNQQQ